MHCFLFQKGMEIYICESITGVMYGEEVVPSPLHILSFRVHIASIVTKTKPVGFCTVSYLLTRPFYPGNTIYSSDHNFFKRTWKGNRKEQ